MIHIYPSWMSSEVLSIPQAAITNWIKLNAYLTFLNFLHNCRMFDHLKSMTDANGVEQQYIVDVFLAAQYCLACVEVVTPICIVLLRSLVEFSKYLVESAILLHCVFLAD